ncbi:MAG: M3 family oligoendopeptidase [Candidatus Dormibacteraceae bacterium]
MATTPLPDDAAPFLDAGWDDIQPHYDHLATCPLDLASIETWLARWSRLTELLTEAAAQVYFDYTSDTADPAKEAAHLRYAGEIVPRAGEQEVRLAARLLDLGYTRPELETMARRFRNQREIFREENVPLLGELERLSSDYLRVTGAMTAEWEGEQVPVPRLLPHLELPDREIRERAFRALYRPYIQQRDELATIFDAMLEKRQRVARNAGFDSYRDFAHREKHRFDYTPADCVRWHDAVETAVVPALARIRERRWSRTGVAALRPWDLAQDPDGRPPLRPFKNAAELIPVASRAFDRLSPELGGQFRLMAGDGLLDLDSRAGKAPGGYCNELPVRRRPLIFMNAVGVQNDVEVLFHESGHCFHAFATFGIEPCFQRLPGSEMAELASMSMELLGAPFWAASEGGFYADAEYRRARIEHLEGIVTILPHVASVDGFQHWLYTDSAASDRDARDAAWLRIRSRFDPVTDWSGLDAERAARWHYQNHFFTVPFYYIEYGLAQLGALQVWRNALQDPERALRDYRRALALGATRSLPELYGAAGARLLFEPEPMADLIALIEREIERLEAG